MIGKLDDYLRFNETALSLRSQRQELLASNIANADTPNLQGARHRFFQRPAGRAGARQPAAGPLATTAPAPHRQRPRADGKTLAGRHARCCTAR